MKRSILGVIMWVTLAVGVSNAAGQTVFQQPAQAAQALMAAWKAKSRVKATAAASDEAVTKLFGVNWRKMAFKGCTKREEGDSECIFEDNKNDITLAMLIQEIRRRYRIKSLSFSSEAM